MINQLAKTLGRHLHQYAPWLTNPLLRKRNLKKIREMIETGEFLPAPPSSAVSDEYCRASADNAIPKVIHQVWTHPPVPEQFHAFQQSAEKFHSSPEWTHRLWDTEQMDALVKEHFPHFEAAYHKLPTLINKCDTFRYMLLAIHGGVYFDLDYLFYKPIDDLIEDCQLCLTSEDDRPEVKNHLSNFFLAAAPGHPFFHACVAEILDKPLEVISDYDDPISDTGPYLVTRVWNAAKDAYQAKRLYRVYLSIPTEYYLGGIDPPKAARGVHVCSGAWR